MYKRNRAYIPFYFTLGMERSGTTKLGCANYQDHCKEQTKCMHDVPDCLDKVQTGLSTHTDNSSSFSESKKGK